MVKCFSWSTESSLQLHSHMHPHSHHACAVAKSHLHFGQRILQILVIGYCRQLSSQFHGSQSLQHYFFFLILTLLRSWVLTCMRLVLSSAALLVHLRLLSNISFSPFSSPFHLSLTMAHSSIFCLYFDLIHIGYTISAVAPSQVEVQVGRLLGFPALPWFKSIKSFKKATPQRNGNQEPLHSPVGPSSGSSSTQMILF
jgi:hypothetical protein